MTQVLIVEDQKMIRESLENLVAQADDLSPAGSLSCAALAEQYCMRGNIDLILMDVCTEMMRADLSLRKNKKTLSLDKNYHHNLNA